jgi:hypothetical protein
MKRRLKRKILMKSNYRKAYNKLKSINAPVIDGGWNGEDTFRISGENNHDSMVWADYWNQSFGDFGVNPEISNILNQYGLFAEWINAGILGVYDA